MSTSNSQDNRIEDETSSQNNDDASVMDGENFSPPLFFNGVQVEKMKVADLKESLESIGVEIPPKSRKTVLISELRRAILHCDETNSNKIVRTSENRYSSTHHSNHHTPARGHIVCSLRSMDRRLRSQDKHVEEFHSPAIGPSYHRRKHRQSANSTGSVTSTSKSIESWKTPKSKTSRRKTKMEVESVVESDDDEDAQQDLYDNDNDNDVEQTDSTKQVEENEKMEELGKENAGEQIEYSDSDEESVQNEQNMTVVLDSASVPVAPSIDLAPVKEVEEELPSPLSQNDKSVMDVESEETPGVPLSIFDATEEGVVEEVADDVDDEEDNGSVDSSEYFEANEYLKADALEGSSGSSSSDSSSSSSSDMESEGSGQEEKNEPIDEGKMWVESVTVEILSDSSDDESVEEVIITTVSKEATSAASGQTDRTSLQSAASSSASSAAADAAVGATEPSGTNFGLEPSLAFLTLARTAMNKLGDRFVAVLKGEGTTEETVELQKLLSGASDSKAAELASLFKLGESFSQSISKEDRNETVTVERHAHVRKGGVSFNVDTMSSVPASHRYAVGTPHPKTSFFDESESDQPEKAKGVTFNGESASATSASHRYAVGTPHPKNHHHHFDESESDQPEKAKGVSFHEETANATTASHRYAVGTPHPKIGIFGESDSNLSEKAKGVTFHRETASSTPASHRYAVGTPHPMHPNLNSSSSSQFTVQDESVMFTPFSFAGEHSNSRSRISTENDRRVSYDGGAWKSRDSFMPSSYEGSPVDEAQKETFRVPGLPGSTPFHTNVRVRDSMDSVDQSPSRFQFAGELPQNRAEGSNLGGLFFRSQGVPNASSRTGVVFPNASMGDPWPEVVATANKKRTLENEWSPTEEAYENARKKQMIGLSTTRFSTFGSGIVEPSKPQTPFQPHVVGDFNVGTSHSRVHFRSSPPTSSFLVFAAMNDGSLNSDKRVGFRDLTSKQSNILIQPSKQSAATTRRQTLSFLQRRKSALTASTPTSDSMVISRTPMHPSIHSNGTAEKEKHGPSAVVAKRILDSLTSLTSPMEGQRLLPTGIPTNVLIGNATNGTPSVGPIVVSNVSSSKQMAPETVSKTLKFDLQAPKTSPAPVQKPKVSFAAAPVESSKPVEKRAIKEVLEDGSDKEFVFQMPAKIQGISDEQQLSTSKSTEAENISFMFSPPGKKKRSSVSSSATTPSKTVAVNESVKTTSTPNVNLWASAAKSDSVKCPVCMVPNSKSSSKCVSCESSLVAPTSKPAASATVTAPMVSVASTSSDSIWSKAASSDTVKCSACFVPNSKSATKCVSCETPLNGSAASTGSSSTTSSSSWAPIPVQAPSASGFTFGAPPSNAESASKPQSAPSIGFSFGAPTVSTPAVAFGAGSSLGTATEAPNKAPEFSFSAPVKQNVEDKGKQSNLAFSFGAPSTTVSAPKTAEAPAIVPSVSFGGNAPAISFGKPVSSVGSGVEPVKAKRTLDDESKPEPVVKDDDDRSRAKRPASGAVEVPDSKPIPSFAFSSVPKSTVTDQSPSFSFGSASNDSKTPAFSFGKPGSTPLLPVPNLVPPTSDSKTEASAPFAFGKPPVSSSSAPKSSAPAFGGSFNFGSSSVKNDSLPPVANANPPTSTPAAAEVAPAPFAFGASSPSPAAFSFAKPAANANDKPKPSENTFTFGATAPSSVPVVAPQTTSTPAFSFGASSKSSEPPKFGSTSSTAPAPFAFGATASSAPASTTTSTVAPFVFGASNPAPSTSPAPFAFGAGVSSVTAAPAPFAFGASSSVHSAVPDSPNSTVDMGYGSGDASNISAVSIPPPSAFSQNPFSSGNGLTFGASSGFGGSSTNSGIAFGRPPSDGGNMFGGPPLPSVSSNPSFGSIGQATTTSANTGFAFGAGSSSAGPFGAPPAASAPFGSMPANGGAPAVPFGGMGGGAPSPFGGMSAGGAAPSGTGFGLSAPAASAGGTGGFSLGATDTKSPRRRILKAKRPGQ